MAALTARLKAGKKAAAKAFQKDPQTVDLSVALQAGETALLKAAVMVPSLVDQWVDW